MKINLSSVHVNQLGRAGFKYWDVSKWNEMESVPHRHAKRIAHSQTQDNVYRLKSLMLLSVFPSSGCPAKLKGNSLLFPLVFYMKFSLPYSRHSQCLFNNFCDIKTLSLF